MPLDHEDKHETEVMEKNNVIADYNLNSCKQIENC